MPPLGPMVELHRRDLTVLGSLTRLRVVQIVTAVAIILIGALESWTHRFVIYSDGLSYLDIADSYAAGHWSEALNAYWSPLYSWLIAAGKLIMGSSPQRELTILQTLNFLCFLAALVAFEFLIREILRSYRESETPVFMVVAHLVFGWASLALVATYRPHPDMLVMAFWLAASSFILRINRTGRLADHLILGVVLGLAYLAKTAMLVIALITFAATVRSRRGMAGMAVFGVIAVPWIAAISVQKGRVTIGDSGRLNYAWEVNGIRRSIHWQSPEARHPTRVIRNSPEVFEFAEPQRAFYPPWRDPSYWYEGLRVPVALSNQFRAIAANGRMVTVVLLSCPALVALIVVLFRRRMPRPLSLILIGSAAVAMYTSVFVEPRYVAGFVCVPSLIVLASAFSKSSEVERFFIASAAGIMFTGTVGFELLTDIQILQSKTQNPDPMIAAGISAAGAGKSLVAYIGVGMSAYPVRLAGGRIICEIPAFHLRSRHDLAIVFGRTEIDGFWASQSEQKREILGQMRQAGAAAVIADHVPAWADTVGWTFLGKRSWTVEPERPESDARTYLYTLK